MFGTNLKLARLAAKLKQKQLADKMGVDKRTIENWENGISEPKASAIIDLCKILKTSPDRLLDYPSSNAKTPEMDLNYRIVNDLKILAYDIASYIMNGDD